MRPLARPWQILRSWGLKEGRTTWGGKRRVTCRAGEGRRLGQSERNGLKYEELSEECRGRVDTYLRFLLAENEKYNLTGLRGMEECADQIVNDSAALIPLIESHFEQETLQVVDVGSGAGVPGIIFATLRQNWNVLCIEGTRKKANFITHAIDECKLENIQVVKGRAEEIAHDIRYRETFDVAVSRGVGELRVISEYCLPFLKQQGLFIAPKGPNIQEEVSLAQEALSLLGGSLKAVSEVDSFGSLGQRTAVQIEKFKPTPSKYPRKPGTPAKRPL